MSPDRRNALSDAVALLERARLLIVSTDHAGRSAGDLADLIGAALPVIAAGRDALGAAEAVATQRVQAAKRAGVADLSGVELARDVARSRWESACQVHAAMVAARRSLLGQEDEGLRVGRV